MQEAESTRFPTDARNDKVTAYDDEVGVRDDDIDARNDVESIHDDPSERPSLLKRLREKQRIVSIGEAKSERTQKMDMAL